MSLGKEVKKDFPIFQHYPHTFLDNAATTHKPKKVLDAMHDFQTRHYGSVRRGLYQLSSMATDAYEQARSTVAAFVGASRAEEVVFTSGATEGLNLIASSYLSPLLQPGQNVVCTVAEHHANFIPWQQVAHKVGAEFRCVPLSADHSLDLEAGLSLIDEHTKLVAIAHLSNVLGIVHPVQTIIERAHAVGAVVVLDAAQSVAHFPIDVGQIDCDFLVFSGHKIYGPNGIGVLYGKYDLLENMPPYQYGGDMIKRVTLQESTWQEPPHRFEAGTPPATPVIGLAAAIEYLTEIGSEAIQQHSRDLTGTLRLALEDLPDVECFGRLMAEKYGIASFNLTNVHPHDVASILDQHRVCIRAGHHCAQPLMQAMKVGATARASLGIYNDHQDILKLVEGIKQVQKIFHV